MNRWPLSARLAGPIEGIRPRYDVVVVGSGYGGGVAASRLARAGRRVCVLERGLEHRPGEYPDTLAAGAGQFQVTTPHGRFGPRTGLFDLRVEEGMNALVGCGLGGTSLINANVALPPDPRIWAEPVWPADIRADGTGVAAGYRRAEAMLRPSPYPGQAPHKLEALALSAAAIGRPDAFSRPPVTISFTAGVNHVGVEQRACSGCGDCVSGCNVGAKNTTLMTYLPDAVNHGAEIFTGTRVSHVVRDGARWTVHLESTVAGPLTVAADVVVLAAGALGTPEILLRSREHGLPTSDRLGERFTGNGDVLAFAYDCARRIDGVGTGNRRAGVPVGACITGIVDCRDTLDLRDGFVIEEGAIPGAIASLLPVGFAAADAAVGVDTRPDKGAGRGLPHRLHEAARMLGDLVPGHGRTALDDTQTFLVMTHDNDDGRLRLVDDRLRIDWPGVGREHVFATIDETLRAATRPLDGLYLKDILWTRLLKDSLITVHPLGGCALADEARDGVLDSRHRVFAGTRGTTVHDGLYVLDGSAVPTSLGVNPLLTITALAERAVALLAMDRGWVYDDALPSRPPVAPPRPVPGLRFTERMVGRLGAAPIQFTVTVGTDDLRTMIVGSGHRASIVGTLTCPTLSPEPLTVEDGVFQLFVTDPSEVDGRRMTYRMPLTGTAGERYLFTGYKLVDRQPATRLWAQTTTLHARVEDPAGAVIGTGVLHIHATDFIRQLATIRVSNAPDTATRARLVGAFGRFFAGNLWDAYGPRPRAAASPSGERPVPHEHPVAALLQSAAEEYLARCGTPGRRLDHPLVRTVGHVAGHLAAGREAPTGPPANLVAELGHGVGDLWTALRLGGRALAGAATGDTTTRQQALDDLAYSACDPGWVSTLTDFLGYLGTEIPYRRYRDLNDFVLAPLPHSPRVALLGDWATGTVEARDLLADLARHRPDAIVHLGDIYYAATPREARAHFLDVLAEVFPRDGGTRVYTLAGNHDMYAAGSGYYDILPLLNPGPGQSQPASYFALPTGGGRWQLLACDTGREDRDPATVSTTVTGVDPAEQDWLADKVANGRRTILLSHHQPFSAYERIGGRTVNPRLLAMWQRLCAAGDIPAWFWGHEHRLAVYQPYLGIPRGRCVGHGAVPALVRDHPYRPLPNLADPPGVVPVPVGNDGTAYRHGYAILDLDDARGTATARYFEAGAETAVYSESIPAR